MTHDQHPTAHLIDLTFTENRTVIATVSNGGRLTTSEFDLPDEVRVYRGIWKSTRCYAPGDCVWHEACLWFRVPGPRGYPGYSDAWTLLAEQGNLESHLHDLQIPSAMPAERVN